MRHTLLHFPEIHLDRRSGHKIRGYFSELFGQESDLFHNHTKEGKPIYRYPKIQYKVVHRTPMAIGINEGADLLTQRFLRIKELILEGKSFPVHQKNLSNEMMTVGVKEELYKYAFLNPWLALNPDNYKAYVTYDQNQKNDMLSAILIRNIQSFFSSVDHFEKQKMMVKLEVKPIPIKFKNTPMIGFKGTFVSNVDLPNYIGVGKSVARGFGAIKKT